MHAMSTLGEYIAGRGSAPSRRDLNRILDRHEWFSTARRARALITGEPDSALTLPLMFWPTVARGARETALPEKEKRQVKPDGATNNNALIDRFIAHGGYRIVPADEECEVTVDVDIDPQMVTPELAEIYRAQGLTAEAEKIYRILKTD